MIDKRQSLEDLALLVAEVHLELERAGKALSQAKLARRADIDPGTLNKFLNGADIRVSTALRIFRAAGYKIELRKTA